MKITKSQLKQIVKEELEKTLVDQAIKAAENAQKAADANRFRNAEIYIKYAIKLINSALKKSDSTENKELLRKFIEFKVSITQGMSDI